MAVALQVQEFLDSPPMCEVCGHFSRPAGALSEEPLGGTTPWWCARWLEQLEKKVIGRVDFVGVHSTCK